MECVVLGWDGATFSLLDPLADRGIMPNLKKAFASGVRANLRSIIPPLTPPAWTSLITGRTPDHHGVFDFFQKEAPDSLHLRMALSTNVHTDTLWTLSNRAGKRATVLNFPVTFPPPKIEGYVISGGWLTRRQLRLACRPASLYDDLRGLEDLDLASLAFDMSHEEKAVEGCGEEERLDFVEKHVHRERQWFRVLRHLCETDPTEILTMVFDGIDKIQHLCWGHIAAWARDPSVRPADDPILAACLTYYEELDRILAWCLDRKDPGTHLFIVSDHGFGESRDIFYINQWLHENGYLRWKAAGPPRAGEGKAHGMAHIARHVFEIDWDNTRAYATTPSSNGIHLMPRENPATANATAEEKDALADEMIARLLEIKSPTTGEALVKRVSKKTDTFPGPYGNLGPDLTLALWDGGLVSILASETSVARRAEPIGAHRPEGVFIGLGPLFEQAKTIDEMSILDVLPTILSATGQPIPSSLEGKAPEAAFIPGATRGDIAVTHQPESDKEKAPETPKEEEPLVTEEEEKAIADRLRQLGYLE